MKPLIISLLGILATTTFVQAIDRENRDSIIVNFGDKTKIVIYAEKKEDFQRLLRYDLNALLRDLGAKIDTVSKNGETRVSFDQDARKYQKDTTIRIVNGKEENYVRIGVKGIHIKDGSDEVHINTKGVQVKDGDQEVNIGNVHRDDDSTYYANRTKNKGWRLKSSDFMVSLGLNSYVGAGGQSVSGSDYDLRPFGSRFVSLAFNKRLTLARGEKAAFRLKSGFEFSWYNFMFDGNNVATKGPSRVEFPESTRSLDKSKLTVSYLNIPLMPYVSFRNGAITHIGAGGYAGYRLGSHTKVKYAEGGKDHVKGNYYLNDFRYGLMAEIGFRNAPDFFFQYDFNELFVKGKGPQLNAISFGIRL